VLLADDPRPVAQRLTREAKRLLVAAAVLVLLFVGLVIGGVAVLIVYYG